MKRPMTEHEAKGGRLPKVLAAAVDRHWHKLSVHRGLLAVDHDSGFATANGMAWDVLLRAGWRHSDEHRVIIEGNSATAAALIRGAEPCDCEDCKREEDDNE